MTSGTGVPASRGDPPRVLVVDDNPFNVKLAVHLLKAEGFEVRSVEAPEEVAPAIAIWRPDVVLMDLRLPGMDGLTLTRRLRADPAHAGIAIVAFSADRGSDERQSLEAGCNGFITKPIEVTTFGAEVRRFVGAGPP
jgi:CheY-like chemotaxis protein